MAKKRFKKIVGWTDREPPHIQLIMAYIPLVVISLYALFTEFTVIKFILIMILPALFAFLTTSRKEIYYEEV